MGYLDVLRYLQDFKIDRYLLSDFQTEWVASDNVTTSLTEEHVTVEAKSVKIEGLDSGEFAYNVLSQPLRLDDRNTISLHVYSTEPFGEGDLKVRLSDSPNFLIPTLEVELPAIPKETPIPVMVEIPNPDVLSTIKSSGIVCTANTGNATLYISSFNANSDEYIITKEQVEEFETKSGVSFVLSKIEEGSVPDDSPVVDAVYKAAAAYAWMWRYEHETHLWDYGDKLATKNYAIRLLKDAETQCEEYMLGGDTGDGGSLKRLRIKGGYSTLQL